MKTCIKCNQIKLMNEFYINNSSCKKCVIDRQTKWNNDNKEKKISYHKKDREKNRERERQYSRSWRKNNKEKKALGERKRAALKRGLTATLTYSERQEVWEEFNGICFWCQTSEAENLEHIIPLSPRPGDLQGHHTKSNVVPSCQPCNNKKYNKDPLLFLFEIRGFDITGH